MEGLRYEYGPLTPELYAAGVDVAGYINRDWNALPVSGLCNFSSRATHAYPVDAFGVKGTLYTYFDYLNFDCTAERQHETRPCQILASSFTACRDLALDVHAALAHSWTTCEDYNFRVGYLWVSTRNNLSNAHKRHENLSQLRSTSANAEELATLYLESDHRKSNVPDAEFQPQAGGRGVLGCNWKYSNLFPVAYDGISNVLFGGQYIMAANDQYSFMMQADCNLVLYKRGPTGQYAWNGLWATMTNISDGFSHKCTLELQPDGNLVVNDDFGLPRWSSGVTTSNLYQVALTLQHDGNVVISDMQNGVTIWETNTAVPPPPPFFPAAPPLPLPTDSSSDNLDAKSGSSS